jgi:hypothetical protein
LEPTDINEDAVLKLKEFHDACCSKRPHLKKGDTMSFEEKELVNARSDWLFFLKSVWSSSGLFDNEKPMKKTTEMRYDDLVHKFSLVVFETVFGSLPSMTVDGVVYPVITFEGKLIYVLYFYALIFVIYYL